jgi:hypothetical protein
VVQGIGPRQIRFEGFQVVDQVFGCTVDIHAGGTSASGCFWSEKLTSGETVVKVVREQGPFRKSCVILVEN